MPKFDGAGPGGRGPMTGQGNGSCVIPLNTDGQELEYLKNREQSLKKQLNRVINRIKGIESKESDFKGENR
jgi:hypothetical protein